jgi:hypothetical protein
MAATTQVSLTRPTRGRPPADDDDSRPREVRTSWTWRIATQLHGTDFWSQR